MSHIKNTNNLLSSIKINYLAKNSFSIIKITKSNVKLCQFLLKNNLINGFICSTDTIKVKLSYSKGLPLLTEIKSLSKPSKLTRKTYKNLKDMKKKKNGCIVMDTDIGFLFFNEAIRQKKGGVLLFTYKLLI